MVWEGKRMPKFCVFAECTRRLGPALGIDLGQGGLKISWKTPSRREVANVRDGSAPCLYYGPAHVPSVCYFPPRQAYTSCDEYAADSRGRRSYFYTACARECSPRVRRLPTGPAALSPLPLPHFVHKTRPGFLKKKNGLISKK